MLRRIIPIFALVLVLVLAAATFSVSGSIAVSSESDQEDRVTIILDAGHGGLTNTTD